MSVNNTFLQTVWKRTFNEDNNRFCVHQSAQSSNCWKPLIFHNWSIMTDVHFLGIFWCFIFEKDIFILHRSNDNLCYEFQKNSLIYWRRKFNFMMTWRLCEWPRKSSWNAFFDQKNTDVNGILFRLGQTYLNPEAISLKWWFLNR